MFNYITKNQPNDNYNYKIMSDYLCQAVPPYPIPDTVYACNTEYFVLNYRPHCTITMYCTYYTEDPMLN